MTGFNVANPSAVVTIAGVEVPTDLDGRFNLNALHKASRQGDHKKPSEWLRTKQAQELIEELSGNLRLGQKAINSARGGTNPGTFAHELLAVSYAGWISPAFQLQVNQAFINYRTGKLSPSVTSISRKDLAYMLIEAEEEKERLLLENTQMKPSIEAFNRIATKTEGAMCITDAAKHLQVKPKQLFRTLSEHQWIYRRTGGKCWLGYQDKIQQGLLEHKVTTVSRSDGSEKIVEQVLITAKGLAKLAKVFTIGLVA